MDNIQEYISSGVLELYVYGALSTEESIEVTNALKEYPEVRKEVEEIEIALQKLSGSLAPHDALRILNSIKSKLGTDNVKRIDPDHGKTTSSGTNWVSYIGWAASILLLAGLFFLLKDNNELRQQLNTEQARNARMEEQIVTARQDAENAQELLAAIRGKEVNRVPLPGQEVAPEAYATVYWNTETQTAYIDALDLPEPPEGMVYQVWSLTLDPLTPTSIGLLDDFTQDNNKIFALENPNQSQAFGITLEPAGGSEAPTMEQLYVLGTVS